MFGPIAAAALALTATAAPAGPAAPAKSRAATLARFVGEQTAIVIRIDAARIDAAAVAANLRGLVGGIDTDEKVKKAVAA